MYDFRNPLPGQHGFSWKETSAVPPEQWTVDEFNAALETEPANRGFGLDMAALIWCDVCVCVLPSGKDAHLEVGWAAGAGKKTAVLLLGPKDPFFLPGQPKWTQRGWEPGLMYKMCDLVVGDVERVSAWLRLLDEQRGVGATEVVASREGRHFGPMGSCG